MRLNILQTVLLATAFLAVVLVVLGVWQHNIMMSRMMGMYAFQPIWWIGPAVMLSITIIIVLLVLYLAFFKESTENDKHETGKMSGTAIRALTEDEKRVVEYIINNGGEALQKDIAKDLNLSRLKTHRIITSLKKRGVVSVEPWGNTNLVKLRYEE